MKIKFTYEIGKDIENFRKSARSSNNPKPTKLHQHYIDRYGADGDDDKLASFINSFIKEQKIDIQRKIAEIQSGWLSVQEEFIKRCNALFGVTYPSETIRVYLTTNTRSTYNIEKNYFFLSLQGFVPNKNIMHELFHFYTYHVFYEKLKERGWTDGRYNDVKEALTVLLNVEFSDLMGDSVDKGYPQHQELRRQIKELWYKYKNLERVIEESANIASGSSL
jgi:hypothetical protein